MASPVMGWSLNCPFRAVPCEPRARGTVPGWRMWCGIKEPPRSARPRGTSNFPKEKPRAFSICPTAPQQCPEPRGMVAPSQPQGWGLGTVCLFPLGGSRAHAVCSPGTVGGLGPALWAPSLFLLPPGLPPSLCCSFLAPVEPPVPILCPWGCSAMGEGEDPAASPRSSHHPNPCPGKRMLLLNSLLGVSVSIPLLCCSAFQERIWDVQG